MISLQHRSYQKELLDGDDIPFEDIRRNMQELNVVNTSLGGHAITLKGFRKLLSSKNSIVICEIGCGGGDNLAAIVRWCDKKNISVQCIGIDLKQECIDVAQAVDVLANKTTWITSDYRTVNFTQQPDIIFSSLFCHHFTNDELVDQLRWMQRNSTVGFFINDLHRHPLAYYSIKWLTALFSHSYLVKNDAPLSVSRGFTKNEWKAICQQAGFQHTDISWEWAFRHLIVQRHHG